MTCTCWSGPPVGVIGGLARLRKDTWGGGALVTYRVAGCKGGRELPPDVHEGGVPGCNVRADAEGLVSHNLEDAVILGE